MPFHISSSSSDYRCHSLFKPYYPSNNYFMLHLLESVITSCTDAEIIHANISVRILYTNRYITLYSTWHQIRCYWVHPGGRQVRWSWKSIMYVPHRASSMYVNLVHNAHGQFSGYNSFIMIMKLCLRRHKKIMVLWIVF